MIFHENALVDLIRSRVGGGEGELLGRYAIAPGAAGLNTGFSMAGVVRLMPGCSIGNHTHMADEEIYYIISGEGEYTDHDGTVHRVYAGDWTLTRRGESHGLKNNSAVPLDFLAVVIKADASL